MHKQVSPYESGYILVCFALTLVVVIGFCAFVIDIGLTHKKNAERQIAADIAAYAGALVLPDAANDEEIFGHMNAYAAANRVPNGAIGELSCGVWAANNYTPYGDTCDDCPCANCQDSGVNAVRVQVEDSSKTYFAKVFQLMNLPVNVHSVALVARDESMNCVRPFGIERSLVPDVNGNFVIDRASPGNWGKLNIDPAMRNLSGRPAFEHVMSTDECSINVQEGGIVESESATGFAGMNQVFPSLIGTRMIIPLTSTFGNGNSVVQLLEFIEVEIVSSSGNGNNWQGTFRVIRRGVQPRSAGESSALPPRWVQ